MQQNVLSSPMIKTKTFERTTSLYQNIFAKLLFPISSNIHSRHGLNGRTKVETIFHYAYNKRDSEGIKTEYLPCRYLISCLAIRKRWGINLQWSVPSWNTIMLNIIIIWNIQTCLHRQFQQMNVFKQGSAKDSKKLGRILLSLLKSRGNLNKNREIITGLYTEFIKPLQI